MTANNIFIPSPVDVLNQPIRSSENTAPTFSATASIVSSNTATNVTLTLGSLAAGNGLFDAKVATIRVLNNGTSETITGLTLTLSDDVGGTAIPITYSVSSLSVDSGGTYTWVVPLSSGLATNASLGVTFGTAPVAGSVSTTTLFQGSGAVLSEFSGSNATEGNYSLTWAAGIANPTTAPTLATASTGGSLAGATYYVKYTYLNANGQTEGSDEANIVIPTTTTTNTLTVTIPAFPTGATSADVYIATTSGSETLQGNTTTTTYTQSAALASGAALPSSNTTGQPANTDQTVSVPLPGVLQSNALYLVSVNNPAGLGTSVTATFQNAVNFGGGDVWSTVTSEDVASGAVKSYLVQGWLLGDAASQISATNDDVASSSGGTVQVQVRKV